MKKPILLTILLWCSLVCFYACSSTPSVNESTTSGEFMLKNDLVEVSVDAEGNLVSLKNLTTGHNYATGGYLWRMYYDTHGEREIEILGSGQHPNVTCDGQSIVIVYDKLVVRGTEVDMKLKLTITLEGDLVRFASDMHNNLAHSIVRELHYPLVHGTNYPTDHKLLISTEGGRRYDDPLEAIMSQSNKVAYMTPAQIFRQLDLHYGGLASMNCFMLSGEKQGLYVGSHDEDVQDTWHILRVYADKDGKHTIPEFGMSKYPHCFAGEKWSNASNVLSPYNGSWHAAADKYGAWVRSTWWERQEVPQWVREMKSWQRIIFRHQYGEQFFKYSDLYGRIQQVGESVGASAVHAFGWWKEGMDNCYPDFTPDDSQGGDAGFREAILKFKKSGQKLMVYANGRLMDTKSKYYNSAVGRKISYKSPGGPEFIDQYRFSGRGTYTAEYQAVSFAMADARAPEWHQHMKNLAIRAYNNGADCIFIDQLGKGLRQMVPWDLSREFPVPNIRLLADNSYLLKDLHDFISEECNPDFAIGTEMLADFTAMRCDFVHIIKIQPGYENFAELFRYTFPEIPFSDRRIRDDRDIESRVNMTLIKGLINDIEIYRCRDLIDKTPHYQSYLAKVNSIRDRYKECFQYGTFRDVLGFENSNKEVQAKGFWGKDKMVVVATNEFDKAELSTKISVPGYRYVESSTLGNGEVAKNGKKVKLGQYDVAVLLFEKE